MLGGKEKFAFYSSFARIGQGQGKDSQEGKVRMDILEEYSRHIDKDEIVDLVLRLIEKKTINPPGNEYLAKDIIVSSLKELGAKVEILEKEKGRPNILGRIGEGEPSVAIITHLDVVPAGSGWTTDPFKPQVREGRIYGRGSLDNKGPYAAAWAGVKALLKSSVPLKGSIIIGAVADEERGSHSGMKFLLEKGFSPSFCLIPDGGRLDEAIIGEKGMMWVALRTFGKAAHASTPEEGENAIYKLVNFASSLSRFQFEGEHHAMFGDPTLNLGKIEGGSEAANMVPDRCSGIVDIRYPLGLRQEDIVSQLENLAGQTGSDIKMEVITSKEPHLLTQDHPLAVAFQRVAKDMKLNLRLGTIGGVTIAKDLYFKGIPSIVHSPAEDSVAHQANEYVKVENLVFCAKLWAGVIYELVGG